MRFQQMPLLLLLVLGSTIGGLSPKFSFVQTLLPAETLDLGYLRPAEFRYSPSFFPPDSEPLNEGASSGQIHGLLLLRPLGVTFCLQGVPFLFAQGEAHVHFPYALVLQLIDESPVCSHNFNQSAGGPRESEQSRNANDGADDPLMFSDVNLSHAKRCVAVGTEIHRIVGVHNQTRTI